jgi:hypothetical protein
MLFSRPLQHPAWFNNLVANSTVTVEVGRERVQAKGR